MADINLDKAAWQHRTVNCPSCNCAIPYYDTRKSTYFACPQCATYFKLDMGATTIIKTFDSYYKETFTLPLGLESNLYNNDYKLVGHLYKKQANAEVYWNEYLLYTPADNDYIILSEYDGHWLFIAKTSTKHADNGQSIIHNKKVYSLDLYYKADIVYATGEFDWNILNDEQLTAYEYVSEPRVLINEKNSLQSDWYEGVYQSPEHIMDMFKALKPEQLAPRSGRIWFNPATFYPAYKPMIRLTWVLLVLFVGFHLYLHSTKPEKDLYSNAYTCEADTGSWGNAKPIITSQFNVIGPAPVQLAFSATDLDNDWLELQAELINDQTGKTYEVGTTLEHYFGVADGETWSEGRPDAESLIQGVPSGTYHLNIYPFCSQKNNGSSGKYPSFVVKVLQESYLTSNFIIMLLCIITYPLIQWIRKLKFEGSRWFAPNNYNTKNDI